ncbi:class I SAM-dependent methyltransferase [Nostoc sp. LEGE 12447]|uniref:class I SAM-dependent methyltransferase n=1 Tax=Nostoc sp. LEGE 12447 TaxID=1828640 RepID=UPI001883EF1F|nr:class I SAM-dependent methyltransferase [Nostoc sp. LEGE 12447]MBE9001401.1 class I SAM-dependent methyltransferase [Nostoc sp. LEGE 12447]
MAQVYDSIAQQYKQFCSSPFAIYVETYTYLNLIGDVSGKSILDLACGEGIYSRLLKQNGAARLVGVDISSEMIKLARLEEDKQPLGIEYIIADVMDVGFIENFDIVVASFLLNYASTKDQLLKMCHTISTNLKPGGRFIGLNNNLDLLPEFYHKSEKYGLAKSCLGPLEEGSPLTLTLTIDSEGNKVSFDNYYLSKQTYEWALRSVGFEDIRWHNPLVAPEGVKKFSQEFWEDGINYPYFVGISCQR